MSVVLYTLWLTWWTFFSGGVWSRLGIIFVIPALVISVGLLFFARSFRRARSWARIGAIIIYTCALMLCFMAGATLIGAKQALKEHYDLYRAKDEQALTQEEKTRYQQNMAIADRLTAYAYSIVAINIGGIIGILIILFSKRTKVFFTKLN